MISEQNRIARHVGLVVSAGRTGTAFFGNQLSKVFPNAAAFHEPDIIHEGNWLNDFPIVLQRFGVYQALLGKLIGRGGIRNLSRRFVAGDLSEGVAANALYANRFRFYASRPEALLIEANYAFYGVLPLLPRVFRNYRVAAIVRDPEAWIHSALNKATWYDKGDIVNRLGFRARPNQTGNHNRPVSWVEMNTEERLAWFWQHVNCRLLQATRVDNNIRIFRFEDLFTSDERVRHINDLVTFLGSFDNRSFMPNVPRTLFSQVYNASSARLRNNRTFSVATAAERWCDPLRRTWGYPLATDA